MIYVSSGPKLLRSKHASFVLLALLLAYTQKMAWEAGGGWDDGGLSLEGGGEHALTTNIHLKLLQGQEINFCVAEPLHTSRSLLFLLSIQGARVTFFFFN